VSGVAEIKPKFQSGFTDNNVDGQLGPSEWNESRIASGGSLGDLYMRDPGSATGASWLTPDFESSTDVAAGDATTLASANTHSDANDATTLTSAKNYTDSRTAFDVRSYGAVGDGVADDAAAIQAALTAAGVSGGTVYLPPGIYRTTIALAVPAKVTVRGVPGATILRPKAGNLTPYDAGGGVTWGGALVAVGVANVTIRDLTIDLATSGSFANGVELGYTGADVETQYATVTNLRVLGNPNQHSYQIWNRRARHSRIIANCIDGGDAAPTVAGVDHSGIEVFGATDIVIAWNTVLNLNGTGIGIFTNGPNGSAEGVLIANNYVDTVTDGVLLAATVVATVPQAITDVSVHANIVRRCAHVGISATDAALAVIENLAIRGNTVTDTLDPILLAGTATNIWSGVLIAHNLIARATGTSPKAMINLGAVTDALVIGNVLHTGAYDGITVSAGSDVQVVDNTITDVQHEGIHLGSAVRTAVINNSVRNWDVTNAAQAGIGGSGGGQLTITGNTFSRAAGNPSLVNISSGDQNTVARNKALYATSVVASFRDAGTNSSIGVSTVAASATSISVTNTQCHFTSHVLIAQIAGAPKFWRVSPGAGSFSIVLNSAAVGDEQFKWEIFQ